MRKLMSALRTAFIFLGMMPAFAVASVEFSVVGQHEPWNNNSATVWMTYTSISDTQARLVIEAFNISSYDARICSLAFNNPFLGPVPPTLSTITLVGVTGTANDAGWTATFNPDATNTPGDYGLFDIAAITGKNFNGGKPLEGIMVGETGSFELLLEGTGLDLKSDSQFEWDFAEIGNSEGEVLAVRFQRTGANGEGSDIGMGVPVYPPEVMVPEASSLLTWGLIAICGGSSACWPRRHKLA